MLKRILLICPQFHHYDLLIFKEIESRDKILISDGISSSLFIKILVRFTNRFLYHLYGYLFYLQNRLIINQKYDQILIIRGENITPYVINKLRLNSPDIRLYLWDSISNYPNTKKILNLVNQYITFDPIDAAKFSGKYKQLFNDQIQVNGNYKNKDLDYFSATTFFIGRTLKLYKLNKNLTGRGLIIIYTRNKILFYLLSFIFNTILNSDLIFTFRRLSGKEYSSYVERSLNIIDTPNNNQAGLSLRAVGALSIGCRLITTNKSISLIPNLPAELYTIVDNPSIIQLAKYQSTIGFKSENVKLWVKSILS